MNSVNVILRMTDSREQHQLTLQIGRLVRNFHFSGRISLTLTFAVWQPEEVTVRVR
jgi:hypothetical protein